ncbi:MAG: hypothetical protein KKF22_05970 [Gammaproteobacteria bacterium]|nr:hypothetical protein [Gammaproteobacteria bacterium]
MPTQTEQLTQLTAFFQQIELPYQLTSLSGTSFLPGLRIQNGCLLIDPDKLSYLGDCLHEAGHIAVTTSAKRAELQADVRQSGHGPAEEMAAIAWSWAALQYLKLPPEFLFHSDGYKGGSDAYIAAFTTGKGFGHPLLSWYGMCETADTTNGYPQMKLWLRP